jgi:hypothetical protein
MNFQVGDTVRYLNDVGGGKVSRILSNTMVEIIDESGFEIPVQKHELIKIAIETKIEAEKQIDEEQVNLEDAIEIEGNDTPKFFIAFVRQPKQSNIFDFYIINDCNYHASSVISFKKEFDVEYVDNCVIEANTKLFIRNVSYEEIATLSQVIIQISLFKTGVFQLQKPIEINQEIFPVKFYKPGVFVVNDFFDEDAYVIDVFPTTSDDMYVNSDLELQNLLIDKLKMDSKPNQTSIDTKEDLVLKEVDLHIHELIDNEVGLDSAAKLQLQLQTFEKELAIALQSKLEKIVFIHGVGNGVLKTKIRGILDRDYSFLFYQDASFQKYKFGATLIYLKRMRK